MNDYQLKSCPCCGSTNVQMHTNVTNDYPYQIECFDCGIESDSCKNVETIIERWNERKPLTKLIKELEKRAVEQDRIMCGCSNVDERHEHCKIADTYRQVEELINQLN